MEKVTCDIEQSNGEEVAGTLSTGGMLALGVSTTAHAEKDVRSLRSIEGEPKS